MNLTKGLKARLNLATRKIRKNSVLLYQSEGAIFFALIIVIIKVITVQSIITKLNKSPYVTIGTNPFLL